MIINGNSLEYLKTLQENSIDAIVTDPPYGLSFMGKKWDYDVPSVELWQECLRVLKPGGYLLAFAGTRTQHRMAVRIEDAGFEIRDMIAWVYGSGFPKSLNIGKAVDKLQGNEREEYIDEEFIKRNPKDNSDGVFESGLKDGIDGAKRTKGTSEWEGWGTALKPALEPITVARKPIEGTVAENCLKWGVGGINIDGSRVGTSKEVPASASGVIGIFENGHKKMENRDGMNPDIGRFPANLIHDGSEEVLELFPDTKSGVAVRRNKGIVASKNVKFNTDDPTNTEDMGYNDSGSAARFFYCAKASKSERNMGLDGFEEKEAFKFDGGIKINQWTGEPEQNQRMKNFHPTVKPIKLMEYLVNLVSKEGHTVLDPFAGSGTTGIACKNLNREFIGVELDPEYCKIAEARINHGRD